MTVRDWTSPTIEMSDMICRSAVTLRAACTDLGLPTSGSKVKLAGRLLDAGLSPEQVQERYGWKARSGASPSSSPPGQRNEPRSWSMFVLRHDRPGSRQFYGIGPHHYARLHGGTPVPVVVTEDPDGDMLGWIEADEGTPVMIQHKRIFDVQFPYGAKAAVDRGCGAVVPLRVEEAPAGAQEVADV